jgi:hypothetical protein
MGPEDTFGYAVKSKNTDKLVSISTVDGCSCSNVTPILRSDQINDSNGHVCC